MSYRVRFHPAVSDDLRGIARSMLPHAGKTITTRVASELRDAARSLQEAPHRGSLRHEIMPGLRAIPAARRGVIAFTVDDATREVFVLIIAYGGADWVSRVPGRRASGREPRSIL
ncbi:type II toxin-antitoxin system RelE/ParE family toxin [Paracoccus sp. Z118]|uniref:type II toxin-antitoxin system RelE/ParE family toxin n=1 Tax=Paracoccus sp. Z118 TaxID=2851017 RepID=UPI001C2C7144|nr:type II toxin-antitoxin system RelE/ParE family toxin [Paracoccus sp. Z118]